MSDIYVKKPVNVQAWQFSETEAPPQWVAEAIDAATIHRNQHGEWFVETKEGALNLHAGQWIIRAFDGRIWPTDDKYFQENYQRAE